MMQEAGFTSSKSPVSHSGPKDRTGSEKEEVRRFRFEPPDLADLGIKALVQKNGELERRSLSKICEGARGAAGPPPGGLGGWKPPRNSPPVKTILW